MQPAALDTWKETRCTEQHATYALGVYLVSADSLLRRCSALSAARRWKSTYTPRRRRRFVRKCVARRVYMSQTTFHEWVEIKDGRGCSEEVVAKGKGHARKNREETTGTRTPPTNQRAVRSSVTPPIPLLSKVHWSGTVLPPMGVRRVWQGTVDAWNERLVPHFWASFLNHCRWKRTVLSSDWL